MKRRRGVYQQIIWNETDNHFQIYYPIRFKVGSISIQSVFEQPFQKQLEKANNILIAGAGGGFDVYAGIPLYFQLLDNGKNVFLGSFSFSSLDEIEAPQYNKFCKIIDHTTELTQYTRYCPEQYLSQWLNSNRNMEVQIYSYRGPPIQIKWIFDSLTDELELDTIILIDGGTDSLMRGDEYRLGTPVEDIASIIGCSLSSVQQKLLTVLGFGIESDIVQEDNFRAIAQLVQEDGFLGT